MGQSHTHRSYTLYSGTIFGGRALAQLAQAPTQDYRSYTHAVMGGVDEDVRALMAHL